MIKKSIFAVVVALGVMGGALFHATPAMAEGECSPGCQPTSDGRCLCAIRQKASPHTDPITHPVIEE